MKSSVPAKVSECTPVTATTVRPRVEGGKSGIPLLPMTMSKSLLKLKALPVRRMGSISHPRRMALSIRSFPLLSSLVRELTREKNASLRSLIEVDVSCMPPAMEMKFGVPSHSRSGRLGCPSFVGFPEDGLPRTRSLIHSRVRSITCGMKPRMELGFSLR